MRTLAALLVLLAGGCSPARDPEPPGSPGLRLELRPEQPARGDTVVLTLTNSDAADTGYNLCTSALMTEGAGGWVPVPSDRVCTMELRTLVRGQRDTFPIPISSDLPPGRYRFETQLENLAEGSRETIATEVFTLGG